MLHRHLAIALHRAADRERVVVLEGPRGAGKTTLLRNEFPGHTYTSLDSADVRQRAREDPAAFFARFRGPAFIDDLHRAPEAVDYLHTGALGGTFVLASSRRLRLPYNTLQLYAPTEAERQRRLSVSLEMLGRFVPVQRGVTDAFPSWKGSRGFLTHDVRDLVSVHDGDRFERFIEAVRRRSGEILDQQALARECSVSHRTANRWLGVLADCFQTIQIPASEVSYGRRLVRRPKLHFLEGGPFESRVVSEIYRNACHAGETPDLRHWRDSNGLAVPLIVQESDTAPMPVGIGDPVTPRELEQLRRWMTVAGVQRAALISNQSAGKQGARDISRYTLRML